MFVLLLIGATVFVTNMLVTDNVMEGNVEFLKFYKRTGFKNGTIVLTPFEEIKNTFIMLHDYD